MNEIERGSAPAPLRGLYLDHIGIAVEELEEASAPYRLLGLVPFGADEVVAGQGVKVRLLRSPTATVELLAPLAGDGPVARFLERRGPGLHHLAFEVPDLAAEMERLARFGAEFIDREPREGRGGSRVAFLHPRWCGGVLVELVEHG